MTGDRFACSRPDGRSNVQVIVDLVKDDAPGTSYTFSQLVEALGKDSTHTYGTNDARQYAIKAGRRLLKEHKRTLANVRGVGYRLAEAGDHKRLALVKKSRSDKQFGLGLQILQNVRLDEMDVNQRAAHEGTLMIMSAIHSAVTAMEGRLSRIEQVISNSQQVVAG